jgi:2-keto-3-deoxy-L-fuconate dehydrogenase
VVITNDFLQLGHFTYLHRMTITLTNKVVVITGGASGIGKAVVQQFGQAGAHVHFLDLHDATTIARDFTQQNLSVAGHSCNVADSSSVNITIEKISAQHKRLDVLVNCAGIAHVGNLEKTTEADLDRLFAVNVKGVYNTMLACMPGMVNQKQGVILNMASVAATVGIPDRFAYSMTKGAVIAMSQSVARDYIHQGIRCNTISPARVHTPFVDGFLAKNYPGQEKEMFAKLSKTQPIGRMGTPDEIAKLALYLCSDAASFITGVDYPIDGGFVKLSAG